MELSKYLLPSHSIEVSITTFDDNNKPSILRLKTVIETGYADGFFKIVTPMHHGRMYVLHDNDHIIVTFNAEEDGEKNTYEIGCKVVGKSHQGTMYMVALRVMGIPKKVQRRQSFRVNILNTYTINYKGKKIELTSKDISSTGMRVLSPIQMQADDTFNIIFNANTKDPDDTDELEDPDKIITINCRVVDSMPQTEIRRYMIRLQFLELSNKNTKLITQYLYAKQAEIIALDASLSAKREKLDRLIEGGEDRRIGDDKIIKRYQMIGLFNYVVLFFAIVALLFAQPKPLYSLDKFFNINRAKYWNVNYFNGAITLAITALLLGVYGLVLNGTRMKRKSDRFSSALIASVVIAVILIAFIAYFLSTQNIYNVVY